ncbi:MAG TPA: ABC transporter substrate-binding protein [Rectinemataceae bacterium]|nr:ABC transporter substrate-binding protein [Rectinemataceae bacterium]
MKASGERAGASVILGCCVLALSFLLASCARAPLRIGFVGPLTGSSSAIGIGCRNGLLMALGDSPAAALGKIPKPDIIVMDDRNDPDACLEAFKELKRSGCELVVLGTPSHAATLAVPWAIANGMLVISPTISSPIAGDDSGLFIRGSLPSSAFGEALARAAVERFRALKIGIIGDSRNASYVDALYKGFALEYDRLGGKVAFDRSFDSTSGEPEAGIAELVRAKACDGLLVIAGSTDAALIAKELERSRAKVQLFLPPWPLTPDLIDNGGRAVEGAFAASTVDLSFSGAAGEAFAKAYFGEYGEKPSFTSMFGYESGAILRVALAAGSDYSPEAVKRRIHAIGSFRVLQGTIAFDAEGKVTRTMFLFTIENGAFKRID